MQESVIAGVLSIPKCPFDQVTVKNTVLQYFSLGFDATYTITYTAAEIAQHVFGFMCANATKALGNSFEYVHEGELDAYFFSTGSMAHQIDTIHKLEDFLERKVTPALRKSHAISIRSYHSQSTMSDSSVILLVAELVPFLDPSGKGETFESLTTEKFLRLRPADTRKRYETILRKRVDQFVPVYTINKLDDGNLALKMAFIPDRLSYLAALTTLILTIAHAVINKKFCETFSNGVQVYTYYIRGASVAQLEKAVADMNMLPHVPGRITTSLYNAQKLTAEEVIYCNAITMFAFYFTPPNQTEDFMELAREVRHKPMSITRLKKLRNELFQEIMSESFIGGVLAKHVGLLHLYFDDFQRGTTVESAAKLELQTKHQLRAESALEQQIFLTFLRFNRSVIKTNFFKVNKAAVAFRLDPTIFMENLDVPRMPFGVFLILGSQFRGFHIRFTDIARGGIRMILSNSLHAYQRNKLMLFAENYNLALAQLLKNKDIPEGGSKGTILVSPRATFDRKALFLQYIDALLDLIIPNVDGVRSTMKTQEILFLGPDENTAGAFPAIAALHSKQRGYKQWKSFTTGKDQSLGGIPHDLYGMTSQGVRTYVECIYEKLNLKQENLTKFQTGGPDGDLGSNEILLGKENWIGLVDGSGSLYDPNGIHKEELVRLARARQTLSNFDMKKLSAKGFFVGVQERNRTLPDTTLVEDGEQFRNTFHFSKYCVADTFVPCGGRPASVNLDNVHKMLVGVTGGVTGQMMIEGKVGNLAGSDKLRFKYIVEGANLFITHDARIALENVGVVLIKDSSANKGGVTCSSLEVLSGLSLLDEEHTRLMCVQPGATQPPEFYTQFVTGVVKVIQDNAKREFECLWTERQRFNNLHNHNHQNNNNNSGAALGAGGRMTNISDALSSKIVDIRKFISDSDLYNDVVLRRYVLAQYLPETLKTKVSVEQAMERVPQPYLRAIFAIWIASNFVYTTGLAANDFSFFLYMHELTKKARGETSEAAPVHQAKL